MRQNSPYETPKENKTNGGQSAQLIQAKQQLCIFMMKVLNGREAQRFYKASELSYKKERMMSMDLRKGSM